METLGTHIVYHSEYQRSRTILIFMFSWGPPFGYFTEIYEDCSIKNPKGGPHEKLKIQIVPDLLYSLW